MAACLFAIQQAAAALRPGYAAMTTLTASWPLATGAHAPPTGRNHLHEPAFVDGFRGWPEHARHDPAGA